MKDINSQPLAPRQNGAGARQVFALHCTMAHAGAWRGLAGALSDDVTITAIDMCRHGISPDWDGQGELQLRKAEAA